MSEAELEALVVRMVADASQYISTMQKTVDTTKDTTEQIDRYMQQQYEKYKRIQEQIAAEQARKDRAGGTGLGTDTLGAIERQMAMLAAGYLAMSTVRGAWAWLKSSIDELAQLGREAQRFGITVEKLQALQYSAGREADAWQMGLRRLSMQLGAAAMGGEHTGRAFKELGLDGKQLSQMGLDRAIDVIADKFKEMGHSAAANRIAMELFGRDGTRLLVEMRKGSEGFAKAMQEAKAAGFLVDAEGIAKALRAQEAMDHMDKTLKGLQRSFAVEFAPVVTRLADGLSRIVEKLGGGKAIFSELAKLTVEYLPKFGSMLEGVVLNLIVVGEEIKQISDTLTGKGFGKMLGLSPASQIVLSSMLGFHAEGHSDVYKAAKEAMDKFNKELKGGVDPALDELKRLLDDLGKPQGPMGKAAEQTEKTKEAFDKLKESMEAQLEAADGNSKTLQKFLDAHKDVTAAQREELELINKQLEAKKEQDKLNKEEEEHVKKSLDEAKKLQDEALTGYEKLRDKMRDLQGYLAAGQISYGQYAAAVAKDFGELKSAAEGVKHPEAAAFGGREAYKSIAENMERGRRPTDIQQDIRSKLQELVKQGAAKATKDRQIADLLTQLVQVN